MLTRPYVDLEARALWHLELLGCYEPGDAVAPWVPPPPPDEREIDDDYDGEYMGHVVCWNCEDGTVVDCCDDLCHGQGWCIHGDNRACRVCNGTGWA